MATSPMAPLSLCTTLDQGLPKGNAPYRKWGAIWDAGHLSYLALINTSNVKRVFNIKASAASTSDRMSQSRLESGKGRISLVHVFTAVTWGIY